MRWERKILSGKDEFKKMSTWHEYFVWFPIQVLPGKYIWLERIYRRAITYDDFLSRAAVTNSKTSIQRHRLHLFEKIQPSVLYMWEYKADAIDLLRN